jgi:hypothetical protein
VGLIAYHMYPFVICTSSSYGVTICIHSGSDEIAWQGPEDLATIDAKP